VSHYFLLMTFFCSLFFVGFYWLQTQNSGRSLKQNIFRLAGAVAPVMAILALQYATPIPSSMRASQAQAYPSTGEATDWPHPYLEIFAARPLDYLTGDTGISLEDFFPGKGFLAQKNFEWSPVGNLHERTNGIRWLILLVAIMGSLWLLRRAQKMNDREAQKLKPHLALFWGLCLFGLMLSFPPSYFANFFSPALWLNSLISQFRVSSRAGLFVHFSLLMICGYVLTRFAATLNPPKQKWLWLFPVLILVEFPPAWNPMPAAQIREPFASLQDREYNQCGLGMSFPYVSASVGVMEFYGFLQQMRGSGCRVINSTSLTPRDSILAQRFGLTEPNLARLQTGDSGFINDLLTTADCMRLGFLVFDSRLDPNFRAKLCQDWHGQIDDQGVCLKTRAEVPEVDSEIINRCL